MAPNEGGGAADGGTPSRAEGDDSSSLLQPLLGHSLSLSLSLSDLPGHQQGTGVVFSDEIQ